MKMNLGAAMLESWAEFGVKIESVQETDESLTVYISVPEHSDWINADGEEMAGMFLASRFKTVMIEMGFKRLTVKAKIRTGENWTKEMGKKEKTAMRRTIYGSQY